MAEVTINGNDPGGFMNDLVRKLAEIGYAAYGEEANWRTWDDKQMPKWENVGDNVQQRWITAAAAIASAVYGNAAYTFSEWRTDVLDAASRGSSLLVRP